MKQNLVATLCAFAWCVSPVPVMAQAAPVSPPENSPRAANLDIVANFFMPRLLTTQMFMGACTNTYGERLKRNAFDAALEQKISGVHAKMMAAAKAYCDMTVPPLIATRQAAIRSDWSNLSTRDLARIVAVLAPSVREAEAARIDFRAGETTGEAARHSLSPTPGELNRLRQAQLSLARTPGGVALVNRISAYQTKVQADMQNSDLGGFAPVLRGMMAAGEHAANVAAHAAGYQDVYEERTP